MSRGAWLAIVLLLAAATAGILYYHWRQDHPAAETLAPAAVPPATGEAITPAPTPPDYPVPPAPADAQPLPALNDSDPGVQGTLESLFGKERLTALLLPKLLLRHFVVTVDSLDGEPVQLRDRPLRSVPGLPVVSSSDGTLVWSAENGKRYQPYLALLQAAPSEALVDAYFRFYPLLQAAYEELGYRQRPFNTRVIAIIDHLLATPAVEGPIELVRPKVLYEFADPNLEALSSGQKLMLRIGPDNEAVVMRKLREIRGAIIARGKQAPATPASTSPASTSPMPTSPAP